MKKAHPLMSPMAKLASKTFSLIAGADRVGDDDLLDEIDACYSECHAYRSDATSGCMSLVHEWELNGQQYMGNHWASIGTQNLTKGFQVYYGYNDDGRTEAKQVLNLTLNAILSNVETQTSEAPTLRWEPAEVGDPPVYYLSREGGKVLKQIIDQAREPLIEEGAAALAALEGEEDPEVLRELEAQVQAEQQAMEAALAEIVPVMLEDDQMVHPDNPETGPDVPLRPHEVGQINGLIADGTLTEDDLLEINDKAVTEVAQQTWDYLYKQAGGEQHLVKNELLSNVFGNACMSLQWNSTGPRPHQFSLRNVSIISVWIDPNRDTLVDADYFGHDQVLHKDRAKAEHPHIPPETFDEAQDSLAFSGLMLPRQNGADMRRAGMVQIRTAWLRNKMVPMSVSEALDAGLVDESPVLDEDRRPIIDPDTGRPRVRYTLAGNALKDKELAGEITVEPQLHVDHGTRWPDGLGTLQAVVLNGRKGTVLSKMRCPYVDIPYGWNINIPRPDGSPFGTGEPHRLADISRQINKALTVLARHLERFQSAQMVMPATLFKRLQTAGLQDIFRRPSGIIPLPDNEYTLMIQRGGVKAMVNMPPPMDPAQVNYLTTLIAQHDVLSGNAPVRQGRAPFAGASGRTIEALTQAGEGPVALRAKWTEYMLEHLGRVGLDAAVRLMPESKWLKINSGWTVSAMREILRRLEQAHYNVTASVVSGRGTARAEQFNEALLLFDKGLQSSKTTMDKVGVENPSREAEQIEAEARGGMMEGAPAAPAT